MKKYGKIVCGTLKVPQNYPDFIKVGRKTIYRPSEKQLVEAGYLPIEEKEPDTPIGKVAVASYKLNRNKTKIVQSWSYVDAPANEEKSVE